MDLEGRNNCVVLVVFVVDAAMTLPMGKNATRAARAGRNDVANCIVNWFVDLAGSPKDL